MLILGEVERSKKGIHEQIIFQVPKLTSSKDYCFLGYSAL
jgi:hypothetical protein